MFALRAIKEPVYTHDCDRCVYLGTVSPRSEKEKPIDCYCCVDKQHKNLSSIIGRDGNDGPEYASSHPPEAFAAGHDYLYTADRWYLFAWIRIKELGLL